MESNRIRYFVQSVDSTVQVVIVGAGHVGQALATLCHFVGFKAIIIDDRPEFASRERFPTADDIRVQPSLDDCFSDMAITEEYYVVIVTRGHAFDRSVLAQSLRTPAGYIGMIGSKTKRDAVYKSLLGEGITTEAIGRVHSPIGLAIGAQTPEEIAVSIVAEMIAVRAQQHVA
jgi:xanthine dehydrogenase accessory factor